MLNYEVGDIVTVLTISGEFVGRFENSENNTITLSDPRMLVINDNGMGFAHGVCVTGKNNVTDVTFMNFVLVTPTNDEIVAAWRRATTGLIS